MQSAFYLRETTPLHPSNLQLSSHVHWPSRSVSPAFSGQGHWFRSQTSHQAMWSAGRGEVRVVMGCITGVRWGVRQALAGNYAQQCTVHKQVDCWYWSYTLSQWPLGEGESKGWEIWEIWWAGCPLYTIRLFRISLRSMERMHSATILIVWDNAQCAS